MKLDRSFHIPTDSTEQRDPESSAVAYLYSVGDKPAAACFSGKRAKPDSRYYYGTEAARADAIARHVASVRSRERYQAERREATKKARKAHTSLELPADGYLPGPAVAALLRQSLKEAFPGVKFSVRCSGSLNVNWTDGPSRPAVEAIADRFAGSYFDGMIDYKGSIHHTVDGKAARFGVDFVFCSRTMTIEALTKGAEAMRAHYKARNYAGADAMPATVTVSKYGGPSVAVNPDFPGVVGGDEWRAEMLCPEENGSARAVRPELALERWFDTVDPVQAQASPTFARIAVKGSDGYGNTAMEAADGGPTGRGYPDPSPKNGAGRVVGANALASQPEPEPAPRRVECEVIDLAPFLLERANAARPLN